MSKKLPLFLETTIHGDKIFGEKALQEKIQENLTGRRVCTSEFVLNEFKNTFLKSAIFYHELLVDSPSTHRALDRATRYSERVHKRITKIFAKLCDEAGHNKDTVLERLEMLIEDGFMPEFFINAEEPIINETECMWVGGEPVRTGNRYKLEVYCRKNKPPSCGIESFWNKHKKELDLLSESEIFSRTSDKQLSKLCEVAKKIKDKTDSPYGQNCHIHLSDAVIAVEAMKGSHIYTTNKKHFEPICKVLKDRQVYKEKR